MLSHLLIKNFAIIEEEEIEFKPGFTAIAGETGAGKSIILDAMNLVLGGRASADMVRRGEVKAEVMATFSLSETETEEIQSRLDKHGIQIINAQQLTIKRVVSIHGRNSAQVEKSRVSTATLRAITAGLIEIVRQHESYTLLDADHHLDLLDAFGEHQCQVIELMAEVEHWRNLETEQRRLKASQSERQNRIQELQVRIDHIERLGPEIGEDEQVDRELRLLHAAENLSSWVDQGVQTLYEEQNSVLERIERLSSGLEKLVHVDERLLQFYEVLQGSHLELDELTHDLRRFRGDIPHDQSTLIELETRRAQLEQLKDEYGLNLEEILEQADLLRQERDQLEKLNLRVKAAQVEAQAALATAQLRSKELSKQRHLLADKLSQEIEAELQHLGMAQCRFKVDIRSGKLNDKGTDRIEFLISPNPEKASNL